MRSILILLLIILFNLLVIHGMDRKEKKPKGKSRLGQPSFVREFSFSSRTSEGTSGKKIEKTLKNVAKQFNKLLGKTKDKTESVKKTLQRNMSEIITNRKEHTRDTKILLKKLQKHSSSASYLNQVIQKVGEIEEQIKVKYSQQKNSAENSINNLQQIIGIANSIWNKLNIVGDKIKKKLIKHLIISNDLKVKEKYIVNINNSIEKYSKFEKKTFIEIDNLKLKYLYFREEFFKIKENWLALINQNNFIEEEKSNQELMKTINDEAKIFYKDFSSGCKLVGFETSKNISYEGSEIGNSGELSVNSSENKSSEEIFEEQSQEINSDESYYSERSVSSTSSRKSLAGKVVLVLKKVPEKKFKTALRVCEENIIPLWGKLLEKRRFIRDFYNDVKSSQENFNFMEKDMGNNDLLFNTHNDENKKIYEDSSTSTSENQQESEEVKEMQYVLYQIQHKPIIIYLIYLYEKLKRSRGSIDFKRKEKEECEKIAKEMLNNMTNKIYYYTIDEMKKNEEILFHMITAQFGLTKVDEKTTFDPYGPQYSFISWYLKAYFYFNGRDKNEVKKGKGIGIHSEIQEENIEESTSPVDSEYGSSGHINISSPSNGLITFSDNEDVGDEHGGQSHSTVQQGNQFYYDQHEGVQKGTSYNFAQPTPYSGGIHPPSSSNPPYPSTFNPFYGHGSVYTNYVEPHPHPHGYFGNPHTLPRAEYTGIQPIQQSTNFNQRPPRPPNTATNPSDTVNQVDPQFWYWHQQ